MDSARPFRAFVSYCHADAAFAARLQRRLEGYRLPRRLAGRVVPLPGQAPGRIGPIFRDRADLSAAEDLSGAVREAIAASSALVVVASPDAAGSRWVALEIRLFREHHPRAPVLVALARGEPEAALPQALRTEGIEPLAADFRREGDGKRLAFLKIVAGLTGLPFDALVQRDAQRQLRRVTAITLGTSVLVVVMALLLVVALRAQAEAERRRVEAERQRTAAEGMVEGVLTDIREGLKGTGNLAVMTAVNKRSLDYYAAQGDLSALPDGSLDRRARVLHALGEDQEKRGHYGEAVAEFAEAHRATAAILRRHPASADAIWTHAQSEYWIGEAAWKRDSDGDGDLEQTRAHWTGYLDQARALARIEPNAVRTHVELGYANGNLCELNMRRMAHPATGLEYCRIAVEETRTANRLARGGAAVRKQLANRLGWQADALTKVGEFVKARALLLEETAVVAELLAHDPRNVDLRDRAIWPQIGLGNVEIAEGKVGAGVARLSGCLAELGKMGVEFPDNRLILGERIRVTLLIAAALQGAHVPTWHDYRNRGAALLASAAPPGERAPALGHYYAMLDKLDAGAKRLNGQSEGKIHG